LSDDTVMVRYGSGKSSLSTITAPKQFNNWFDIMQFDYLPFHPEYCVFFENGDFASLAGIAVTPGVIEPPFYSGTFEYFVLLTVDDLPDMRVALTPVRWIIREASEIWRYFPNWRQTRRE
jgi:hypothetical protein